MKASDKILFSRIEKRSQQGALRVLKNKSDLIDFCSNDYLGFANSDDFKVNLDEEIQHEGRAIGSTGSRLITGSSAYIENTESKIAASFNAEAALIFNSGYDANLGLFSCIPQRGDTILYDELIHASIRDGVRLSYAKSHSFKHNDIEHLTALVEKSEGTIFVAVESVYSMDGDMAPLKEIAALCDMHNALFIVDEAHATGVVGQEGKGVVVSDGLEEKVFARLYTFGKALGCHGGVVLGSDMLRGFLINYARSFIYTTALPFHSVAAMNVSCSLLWEKLVEVKKLQDLIQFFRKRRALVPGAEFIDSKSAIQGVIIPGNVNVKKAVSRIQGFGYEVRAVLSPTVPEGKERIRICLHSFNTTADVDGLIRALSFGLA